jgi:putative ABC transport system permease protein
VLLRDGVRFALGAVLAQRQRSLLTALGIAVGIAAVVLLTSLGTGLQRFVLSEFTQFGTNLLQVNPGRAQTFGVSGAILNTVRPLTIDDALALRQLPQVRAAVPVVMGNVAVEAAGRSRRTAVYGVGAAMPEVWRFEVGLGTFLPDDEPGSESCSATAVRSARSCASAASATASPARCGRRASSSASTSTMPSTCRWVAGCRCSTARA